MSAWVYMGKTLVLRNFETAVEWTNMFIQQLIWEEDIWTLPFRRCLPATLVAFTLLVQKF
jgi:hypothetical protein